MTCEHLPLPGGGSAIVCGKFGPRDKCPCGRTATRLCDWKVETVRKEGTCSKPLCDRCTTSPAPDKDLCPKHAAEFEAWKAGRHAR